MNKCIFYDDGHGNGGYCSGASCGPPTCNLTEKHLIPKCNGEFPKCEVDSKVAKERTEAHHNLMVQVKELKKKL